MQPTPDRRQLAAEANIVQRLNAANKVPKVFTVRPDAVVHRQPTTVYRPPEFIQRVAGDALASELARLLAELQAINDEHAGERVLEVVTYYALTGLARDLEERFRAWTERYCRLRGDPA